MIAAITLLLVFAHSPLVRGLVILIIAALSAIAVWEYLLLAKEKGIVLSPFLLTATAGVVTASFATSFYPFVFLAAAILLFAAHFKRIEGALVHLSVSFFSLIYIAVPLGLLLSLLHSPNVDGRFWIIYLLAVTKSADVAGYIGGNLWGRKKLAPEISPSKTVAGALCGLAASVGVSFLLSLFSPMKVPIWVGLGLVLGLISIFGDLSESLLKRDAKTKDSGTIPGIGGVLDLLDSLLFATPLVYFYSKLL